MSNLPSRARVIYQSEALYAGTVNATGHHFTASNDDWDTKVGYKKYNDIPAGHEVRTGIQQLRRVQNANYSFSINRQDVNQFGQLARIDAVAIDPPTVSLDFSYYLTNGINERILGMDVEGVTTALGDGIVGGMECDKNLNADGKNFFILTTCEGHDAVANKGGEDMKSVIALGNGYVSNYSIEASVGSMPTANVTVEGLNLKSYIGSTGLAIPAVNSNYGIPITDTEFSIPPAISGVLNDSAADVSAEEEGWSCLRPGDINLSLGADGRAGEFENLPSDNMGDTPPHDYYGGTAHIQSFSIDVPLSRTVLNRLGTPYGYSRVVDYPINVSVSVNAILADLKEGNVADLLWDTEEHDLLFTLREPDQYGTGNIAMQYRVKGALLEGESFSSSIGDNKSVDLTFTAQIGGPEDLARGLMVLGSRNALTITGEFA
tara:strand:- start:235 stop:1533 length:1299 start_codon:yes stop_codon:yes gene_type:complete